MELKDVSGAIPILQSFGLDASRFSMEPILSGHIHQTYKVKGTPSYVLQRINKHAFLNPEKIASNLRTAADYLKDTFPEYRFLRCILSVDGKETVQDKEGYHWRLFPYIEDAITIDQVDSAEQAFNAATEFGRLSRYLNKIDVDRFEETIPHFHDLNLRYEQFESALTQAGQERKGNAGECITACRKFRYLVEAYVQLIESGALRRRITHNDTKINNILFDKNYQAMYVIDLDTLMPGYFIYDLGDMVRTFVSPVSEEEKDFSKIVFRREIYDAVLSGYLVQMDVVMSREEKRAIPFAGKMMTYIMALRFLADYLNGDVYYHTQYPGQNLVRAGNQLKLLEKLSAAIAG